MMNYYSMQIHRDMTAQVVSHYLDAKMVTVWMHLNAGARKDGLELIVIKVSIIFLFYVIM